jgi:hypothetical protein
MKTPCLSLFHGGNLIVFLLKRVEACSSAKASRNAETLLLQGGRSKFTNGQWEVKNEEIYYRRDFDPDGSSGACLL